MAERHSTLEKMGLILICKKLKKRYKEDKPSVATKKLLYDFFTRERTKRFGNGNPGKTIYVIRGYDYKSRFCVAPVHNLLANYFYVMSHLFYAREKGWIPVVDQQNYPEYNTMDHPVNGTMNAWEYFWKQPGGVSLEEAYKSQRVVLSRRNFLSQWDLGYDPGNYYNKDLVHVYFDISRTIPFNDITREYIEGKKALLPFGGKVLGVNVRIGGHSKKSLNYAAGHPVQPEISDLIQTVKTRMSDWDMEYVFLASDNEVAVLEFSKTFGNSLIVYNRMRAENGKEFKKDIEKNMYLENNIFQTTLDYLTEMELLASCNALIGSVTSGLRYALVRNDGKYQFLEIIDCG